MQSISSDAFADYADAFASDDDRFLTYYSFSADKTLEKRYFTRSDFFSLARKCANVLHRHAGRDDNFFLACFGCNHYADLAFRLAATMTGHIPATINWQGDTCEQVLYKIRMTDPVLILTDGSFCAITLEKIRETFPEIPIYDVSCLEKEAELPLDKCVDVDAEKTKIVIFTSGTTGHPKGVRLSYRAYRANRATFEKLLAVRVKDKFAVFVVNPLHHTNSTAITDWAMRRPGAQIHLVQRYTTTYWPLLSEVGKLEPYDRLVAPVVARHFDFLENLIVENRLPLELTDLQSAMAKIDFLIGSAPVGPTTIERLKKYAGRIPAVRFGSTETCLQVLGIPYEMSENERHAAFTKGWEHQWNGECKAGYFIGQPTEPFTACRIVESIDGNAENFLKDCAIGQPGYLITRGDNIMTEYLGNLEATEKALVDGWYLGLRDICFTLPATNGKLNYYWQSRDSFMLIKGGSNYSYDQVNSELKGFVQEHFELSEEAFDLAVVGMKIDSEHEDSCCVIFECKNEIERIKRERLEREFLSLAHKHVSKGAKPDYLSFSMIPRNFKGAFLVKDARQIFAEALDL